MKWSIVRTCDACGTRAEAPICSRDEVVQYMHVLGLHFAGKLILEACPSCSEEALKAFKALGYTARDWFEAVERARGPRPV